MSVSSVVRVGLRIIDRDVASTAGFLIQTSRV
jgi:hypothetical protein